MLSGIKVAMEPPRPVVATCWNQNGAAFGLGLEDGFEIFTVLPTRRHYRRELRGGIGIVRVLGRSNIVALVGGGREPAFPTTSLILWDDSAGKAMMNMAFPTPVLGAQLFYYRILVVLETHTYLYSHNRLDNIQLIARIETAPNPRGLAEIIGRDDAENRTTLVALGPEAGWIAIGDTSVRAHRTPIAQLAVEAGGDMVATASEQGTIIRVFARSGSLLREFRRGSTPGTIASLAFDAAHLAAISGSGTGHVYSFTERNKQSSLSVLGDYLGYFNSEWSIYQFQTDPGAVARFHDGYLRVLAAHDYISYLLLSGGIGTEEHATF